MLNQDQIQQLNQHIVQKHKDIVKYQIHLVLHELYQEKWMSYEFNRVWNNSVKSVAERVQDIVTTNREYLMS